MILLHPKIRFADDADSPRIQELLKDNNLWVDGLDWSALQGWIVAEHNGEVVGAVQILLGKPLSALLYLVLDLKYHNSGVGCALTLAGASVVRLNNSDGCVGFTDRPEIQSLAIKNGATLIGEFTAYIKRL